MVRLCRRIPLSLFAKVEFHCLRNRLVQHRCFWNTHARALSFKRDESFVSLFPLSRTRLELEGGATSSIESRPRVLESAMDKSRQVGLSRLVDRSTGENRAKHSLTVDGRIVGNTEVTSAPLKNVLFAAFHYVSE